MGSWPEGVPHPPTPQKPEGITEAEWQVYLNNDPLMISPAIRDKVERALGWKKDDVDAAREIAEQVLGAVRIEDRRPKDTTPEERRQNRRDAGLPLGGGLDATDGMGHVPEENVARYTRLRELSHLMSRMGNMVSGLREYDDANTLWAMGGKYKRLANELRAPLPHPRGGLTNNPHEEKQ